MARAHRHFVAGQVWHLTQRCHKKQWLLKFNKDKRRWLYWLFEARRRYGVCVLNYVVTSNHIHLLVQDQGNDEIARSMQLLSGRTAQEYNPRKSRVGAYRQDRYHAAAVQTDDHLSRCLTYIDLNMVRAGVVTTPSEWPYGGYAELLTPPQRYGCLNMVALQRLLGVRNYQELLEVRVRSVEQALADSDLEREEIWTVSDAVGSAAYVQSIQAQLKKSHPRRQVSANRVGDDLRESDAAFQD